jgi:signal transduction histidine kinase
MLSCHADGDVAIIQVADHGPGLAEDRLEGALLPFETFDAARGSRHTGLGLPTVKRIVLRHGGELTLANRPLGGLRAIIRFPMEPLLSEEEKGDRKSGFRVGRKRRRPKRPETEVNG